MIPMWKRRFIDATASFPRSNFKEVRMIFEAEDHTL
jgi:hypothetical protein